MKREHFKRCITKPWDNTFNKVSFKFQDDILYLESSREPIDWWRNFLVIPVLIKIRGVLFFIPLGLYLDFLEIQKIAESFDPSGIVGYSTGADLAALLSAYLAKPAISFGCPNFIIGKKAIPLFDMVEFVQTPTDVVCSVPPVYTKGTWITVLGGEATKPKDVPWIEWKTGHHPDEYLQRMANA